MSLSGHENRIYRESATPELPFGWIQTSTHTFVSRTSGPIFRYESIQAVLVPSGESTAEPPPVRDSECLKPSMPTNINAIIQPTIAVSFHLVAGDMAECLTIKLSDRRRKRPVGCNSRGQIT
jgi:hypothetical protein